MCVLRVFLHSITPPSNSSAMALLCSSFQMPKKTAVNQTKRVRVPEELILVGRQTENEISRCVVCQAAIRATEGEEGERESDGGGVHF